MQFFYFGCIGGPGHFMHNSVPDNGLEARRATSHFTERNPWGYDIDGALCPNGRRSGKEVEGEALIHHKDGWTALSFWDRSVDKRGACNSNFLAEGTFTFDEMKKLAEEKFPHVMRRFTFPIVDLTPQPASPVPPSDKTPSSPPLAPPEEV